MAWIESHQTLGRHPKLIKLASSLNVSKAQAVGHLHYFWWWALDYAQNGNVSKLTQDEICFACEWEGEKVKFCNALHDCGFITKGGEINDWMDYAGKLIEQITHRKEKTRERVKRYRDRRSNASVTRDVTPCNAHGNAGVTPLPNLTVPNHTIPNHKNRQTNAKIFQKPTHKEIKEYCDSIGFDLKADSFFDYYEARGWVIGKNKMKDWKAAVRTWKSRESKNEPIKTKALPSSKDVFEGVA